MVDLKFVDLPGTWQHMTLPLAALDEDDFETGLGFDGSSIRGFQEIHESDMLLMPDATTAFIDPFYTRTTLSLICSIADPILGEPYGRDPRFVAQKAERHLMHTGIADVAYFGPEAEFFVFDHLAYEQREHRAFYEVDSKEGFWNTGEVGTPARTSAYKLRQKEGYFPVPPADSLANLRGEMVMTMESLGIKCEFHHHEVSSGGQGEIDMRFQPLLQMADQMMIYKYVVKNDGRGGGQDRDLHAEADLRGERLRHARPPVAVEGRRAADVRARADMRTCADCAALHRRAARARAGADGVLRADHQLLPAAGARLRGARQPRLLGAQPLGLRARADVPRLAEDKADRVPLAGPDREPLPRLQRADARRARRDQARARPGRAARCRHLRATARSGSQTIGTRARFAGGSAGRARGRPRLPARGRRIHARPDRGFIRYKREARSTRSGCGRIRGSSRSTTTHERRGGSYPPGC